MRASRLLSILMTLQARGQTSAEALAEEFEVSVRTIYRDIDNLSASGVPVYAERGRTGGFRLMDGYRTKLTGLSQPEAEALFLAGLPGPAADLGLREATAAARLKLLAALPASTRGAADAVGQRFHLDPAPWYRDVEPGPLLKTIAEALWTDRRIAVRYESWREVVSRDLGPLGVVLKGGVWYLVAEAGGKPLTYRVSNILQATVSEAAAVRPPGFDLSAYWRRWAKAFEDSLLTDEAVLLVSPSGLQRLARLNAAVARAAEQSARPQPDGRLRVVIPIEGPQNAARDLLSLAAECEVLSPESLRTTIARHAAELAAVYG
ncbi:helix-turn-helix transcriptional regulator [Phenylobacterium sp.]|uniref:helix-turn-helix transcriptional regulator n=1 Tax=Phenylobacterium sp. TaxID=1871053 RepID=UPI00356A265F